MYCISRFFCKFCSLKLAFFTSFDIRSDQEHGILVWLLVWVFDFFFFFFCWRGVCLVVFSWVYFVFWLIGGLVFWVFLDWWGFLFSLFGWLQFGGFFGEVVFCSWGLFWIWFFFYFGMFLCDILGSVEGDSFQIEVIPLNEWILFSARNAQSVAVRSASSTSSFKSQASNIWFSF